MLVACTPTQFVAVKARTLLAQVSHGFEPAKDGREGMVAVTSWMDMTTGQEIARDEVAVMTGAGPNRVQVNHWAEEAHLSRIEAEAGDLRFVPAGEYALVRVAR